MNIFKLARQFELKFIFAQDDKMQKLHKIIDEMYKIFTTSDKLKGSVSLKAGENPSISGFYNIIVRDALEAAKNIEEIKNLRIEISKLRSPQRFKDKANKARLLILEQEYNQKLSEEKEKILEKINSNPGIVKLNQIIEIINKLHENKSQLTISDIKNNFENLSLILNELGQSKGVEQRLKDSVDKYFDIVNIYSDSYTTMGAYGDDLYNNQLESGRLLMVINSIGSALNQLGQQLNLASKLLQDESIQVGDFIEEKNIYSVGYEPLTSHQKDLFMIHLGKYLGLKTPLGLGIQESAEIRGYIHSANWGKYIDPIANEEITVTGLKKNEDRPQTYSKTATIERLLTDIHQSSPAVTSGKKPATPNIIRILTAIRDSNIFQENIKKVEREKERLESEFRGQTSLSPGHIDIGPVTLGDTSPEPFKPIPEPSAEKFIEEIKPKFKPKAKETLVEDEKNKELQDKLKSINDLSGDDKIIWENISPMTQNVFYTENISISNFLSKAATVLSLSDEDRKKWDNLSFNKQSDFFKKNITIEEFLKSETQ